LGSSSSAPTKSQEKKAKTGAIIKKGAAETTTTEWGREQPLGIGIGVKVGRPQIIMKTEMKYNTRGMPQEWKWPLSLTFTYHNRDFTAAKAEKIPEEKLNQKQARNKKIYNFFAYI